MDEPSGALKKNIVEFLTDNGTYGKRASKTRCPVNNG